MVTADDRERRAGPPRDPAPDPRSSAVRPRRANGEADLLVHASAAARGPHASDVRALAAVRDAAEPRTPGRPRVRPALASEAVTACPDRPEHAGRVRESAGLVLRVRENAGRVRRVRESAGRRVVHLHYADAARAAARGRFRPLVEATEAARPCFGPDERSAALRFPTAPGEELSRIR
ncbi:MarR family transcriptional regulator [Streptomyces sp. NPDC029006]|uniref:MarR family transcriptional regulator n=1 Tax=Streptomyces sp. NPDC029006 TaxID=3155467 RepID=UPI0033D47654